VTSDERYFLLYLAVYLYVKAELRNSAEKKLKLEVHSRFSVLHPTAEAFSISTVSMCLLADDTHALSILLYFTFLHSVVMTSTIMIFLRFLTLYFRFLFKYQEIPFQSKTFNKVSERMRSLCNCVTLSCFRNSVSYCYDRNEASLKKNLFNTSDI